jgi:hypothetical protein
LEGLAKADIGRYILLPFGMYIIGPFDMFAGYLGISFTFNYVVARKIWQP